LGAASCHKAAPLTDYCESSPRSQDAATGKAVFKRWFDHGYNLMVPLIGATAVASSSAFLATEDKKHLASALLVAAVPLYTRTVLMPTINELRDDSKDTGPEVMKKWGKMHHVRTGLALSALGFTLFAISRRN